MKKVLNWIKTEIILISVIRREPESLTQGWGEFFQPTTCSSKFYLNLNWWFRSPSCKFDVFVNFVSYRQYSTAAGDCELIHFNLIFHFLILTIKLALVESLIFRPAPPFPLPLNGVEPGLDVLSLSRCAFLGRGSFKWNGKSVKKLSWTRNIIRILFRWLKVSIIKSWKYGPSVDGILNQFALIHAALATHHTQITWIFSLTN